MSDRCFRVISTARAGARSLRARASLLKWGRHPAVPGELSSLAERALRLGPAERLAVRLLRSRDSDYSSLRCLARGPGVWLRFLFGHEGRVAVSRLIVASVIRQRPAVIAIGMVSSAALAIAPPAPEPSIWPAAHARLISAAASP
jgi:hypothetical protein